MLRTSRGICVRGRLVGSIVVRVMLDYRTLPFISSQSPYLESLRPNRQAAPEGVSGRDVEFVGLRLEPRADLRVRHERLDAARPGVPALVESREPFWATRRTRRRRRSASTSSTIAAASTRSAIRSITLVRPPDQPRGAGDARVRAVRARCSAALTLFSALTLAHRRPAAARCSARFDPASTASCFCVRGRRGRPGVHPGVAIRTYFAAQLRRGRRRGGGADRDDGAAPGRGLRGTLQQRGAGGARRDRRSDHGARPRAPSTRTSTCSIARACRRRARAICSRRSCSRRARRRRSTARILLDRLPTFVGDEAGRRLPLSAGGGAGARERTRRHRHRAADQPAAGDRAADRRARSPRALGGRAVQPARRGARLLDGRADRRSGEPADARDAADRARRSRRARRGDLVATNCGGWSKTSTRWPPTCKRQRSELERTQRLEAWADMARQVAHDIKNPLTPIQLSAEHAQRVNIDRGRPLSPVLDECVDGDPVAGEAAAADLGGVLQLRVVADAAARADRRCRR